MRTSGDQIRKLFEEISCEQTTDHDVVFPGPTSEVKDIPTERFAEIVRELRNDGWQKIREYSGFDAWIDYGLIVLQRGDELLKCEWTNWLEGEIEGEPQTVEWIRQRLEEMSRSS